MISENRSTQAPTRWQVIVAFAAVYLIWGSTYLGIRFAIETIPPYLMAAIRFLIAGGALFLWAWLRGAALPTRIHWRSAAIIGGLLLLGGNGSVTWAEQRVPSGLAALLVATVPLWVAVLDWLRPGGTKPGKRTIVGLALGLAGMVALVGPGNLAGGSAVNPLGAIVLILASLSWAGGSLYSRSRHAQMPESPLMATASEMLMGSLMLMVVALISGEMSEFNLAAVSLRSVLAMGYLSLFGSIVAFTAYVWLLKVSTPARASTYAYVNPVVAVFLGWLVAGEPLTLRMLIATPMIIAAVVLITTQPAAAGYATQPEQLESAGKGRLAGVCDEAAADR